MPLTASVIVPTHGRPEALAETLRHLLEARSSEDFEVVVVDDGGDPPVSLDRSDIRCLRTQGVERSRARNLGAGKASGELLIFVDDDITVPPAVIGAHLRAAAEFGDVLCVGRVSLQPGLGQSPFLRFRQLIENPGQARPRGVVTQENFCTAANMSMRRSTFLALGGFDPEILSGEDQDLALRFSSRGGRIVFLPEADVLHRDSNADIAWYCRRHEWGARAMAPLLRRYPDREENKERLRFDPGVSTAISPRRASALALRRLFSQSPVTKVLLAGVSVLEEIGGGDRFLFPAYRALLGLHLFRGFRDGLARVRTAPPMPSLIDPDVSPPVER